MPEITPRPMARTEAGIGGNPLMLVHGLTGGRIDFAAWVEPLAALGWHVVAPDVRGHGDTGGPRDVDAYTLEHIAVDIDMLADELAWDRFVLLGHSMGGVFAQQYAIEHTDRVAGLILMDTAHGPVAWLTGELVEAAATIAMNDGMAALSDLLTAQGPPPAESDASPAPPESRPDLAAEDRAKFIATIPEAYVASTRLLLRSPDRLAQLGSLGLPTLVVIGELDAPFYDDCIRLAAEIPGSTLAVIPGAGHSPQRETPSAWWEAVSGFLVELQGAPRVS